MGSRVTHICVSKLTIIDSDHGLSSGGRQAIIWTSAGILLIRTSGTNFSEISSEIHTFLFKKMHSKMSSAKWHPFCLCLNELISSFQLLKDLFIPSMNRKPIFLYYQTFPPCVVGSPWVTCCPSRLSQGLRHAIRLAWLNAIIDWGGRPT